MRLLMACAFLVGMADLGGAQVQGVCPAGRAGGQLPNVGQLCNTQTRLVSEWPAGEGCCVRGGQGCRRGPWSADDPTCNPMQGTGVTTTTTTRVTATTRPSSPTTTEPAPPPTQPPTTTITTTAPPSTRPSTTVTTPKPTTTTSTLAPGQCSGHLGPCQETIDCCFAGSEGGGIQHTCSPVTHQCVLATPPPGMPTPAECAETCRNRPFPPSRPTCEDVSIARKDPHLWTKVTGIDGCECQADQNERSNRVQTMRLCLLEAIRAATTIPRAAQAVKQATNELTGVCTRFDCAHPYDDLGCVVAGEPILFDEGRLTCGGPVNNWAIQKQGADNLYDVPPQKLKAISLALTSSSTALICGVSPAITPTIAVLLNLRKENGRCVEGTRYAFFTQEPFVKGGTGDREFTGPGTGVPDGRVKLDPPTDPEALAGLDMAHREHGRKTGEICAGIGVILGDPSTLPIANFQGADAGHQRFERSSYCQRDANYRSQCGVKRFSGYFDPKWTPLERCQWAILEHRFHSCWSEDGIKSGNQGITRRCNTAHSFAHTCANYKADNFKILFPCHSRKGDMSSCPKLTCAEYLKTQFPDGGTTLQPTAFGAEALALPDQRGIAVAEVAGPGAE